jgi:hypothetical protein
MALSSLEVVNFALVIGAISAAFVSALWLIRERSKIDRENADLRAALSERHFESRYDDLRKRVEADIAELQRGLSEKAERAVQLNHLQIASQYQNTSSEGPIDVYRFLDNMRIDIDRVGLDSKLIFVLTSFSDTELPFYSTVVDVFSDYGLRVLRGDEEKISGEILPYIVEKIISAKLIIVNISDRNPNVYYELGIAHALGKDVILVSSAYNEISDISFDLRSKRIIFYKDHDDLIVKLRGEIANRYFGLT